MPVLLPRLNRLAAALLIVAASGVSSQTAPDVVRMIEADGVAAKYWPRWRGPSGQGLVPDGAYPDRWSAKENVVWRTPVAGRGNSSPIVWGDRIYLTTAYDGGQRSAIVGFRRSDGKQLFETFVPQRDRLRWPTLFARTTKGLSPLSAHR